ncbi:hypothetical protein BKA64DRAFT_474064 [Cadophora sp. MPI-SDFR-AT-0126]|nr:hypothetical protein BKA64DRAFT_474064 [Leotiomycetes sp. MPI-SDFR-AT-0126]
MSNPVAEYETPAGQPASEYKPILEDVVKLFQQFEKVTMKSLLYETNYHFPTEIGGLPFWVSNIRAVAKECRWRYQRDRTALIKAFEHLLEAESLVRQPLGKREWEKLDIDDAALAKEWEENCVEHIDEIMGVLEKVEEQADVCVYDGNWEKGWTYRGCFPRGKKGREIGRRKRYSNDRSDEGGRQCPRVGKIRKPETRKRLPSHTSDKGCMQCSKGKWNKKVGIQKRYSKDQDR